MYVSLDTDLPWTLNFPQISIKISSSKSRIVIMISIHKSSLNKLERTSQSVTDIETSRYKVTTHLLSVSPDPLYLPEAAIVQLLNKLK